MEDKRNYGIDLLRIIATFMICVLHTLGQGGIVWKAQYWTSQYNIYWFIEIVCLVAVNCYGLISGYNATDRKVNYVKIVKMWFEVLFYGCMYTFLLWLFAIDKTITIWGFIKTLTPLASNTYWYFTGYFVLFFLMPWLNKALLPLDSNQSKKLLFILFFLFSMTSFIDDQYYTKFGYSALWLIILYSMGVLIRNIDLFGKVSSGKLLFMYLLVSILTWVERALFKWQRVVEYTSPTIVLCSIFLLVIFARLKPNEKIVKFFSQYTFGIYLYQNNPYVWTKLAGMASYILALPILEGVGNVLLFAIGLFVNGMFIETIRKILCKYNQIEERLTWFTELILKSTRKLISITDRFD